VTPMHTSCTFHHGRVSRTSCIRLSVRDSALAPREAPHSASRTPKTANPPLVASTKRLACSRTIPATSPGMARASMSMPSRRTL
jgi:hypothetical protein